MVSVINYLACPRYAKVLSPGRAFHGLRVLRSLISASHEALWNVKSRSAVLTFYCTPTMRKARFVKGRKVECSHGHLTRKFCIKEGLNWHV